MIKLLIVDDSALMRKQLSQLFQAAGDFVVRVARNGAEAVAENSSFQPDVVTLDINMPEMDGITALSLMMAERPVAVVMVSSLTEKGALATFEALNLGAVDYVAKPGGTISLTLEQVREDLLRKVRAAARARLRGARGRSLPATHAVASAPLPMESQTQPAYESGSGGVERLVLIGVSTGGPRALEEVLPALPADFPLPILVAQHMPASFTAPFAARLDAQCALRVCEASAPMPVSAGTVYIAKGGSDMILTRRAGVLTVAPKPEAPGFLWHPSVEVLARSALQQCAARNLIGVMLTGMGHDGAEGFAGIKKTGGRTIAEAEATAVVFGMPAELIQRGGASLVLPLDKIATQLKVWAQRSEL